MCVRNLGRLEQPGGCKCNATARGIEQSGRASRSATPPTRWRHLAAAPSGPGAKTAACNVLHPITIGNKKHTHGWDWDASIFHQKILSDPWRFLRC